MTGLIKTTKIVFQQSHNSPSLRLRLGIVSGGSGKLGCLRGKVLLLDPPFAWSKIWKSVINVMFIHSGRWEQFRRYGDFLGHVFVKGNVPDAPFPRGD